MTMTGRMMAAAAASAALWACTETEPVPEQHGEIAIAVAHEEPELTRSEAGDAQTYDFGDGFTLEVTGEPYGQETMTRATAVTAMPSSLYWEGTTGTFRSETLKWASASKAVSSGKISTGRYQTSTPTAYNYYVSSLPITFGSGGSTIAATNATDVIAGCTTAATTSTGPSIAMSHIFARTGSLTLNTQTGFTLSGVSWKIESTSGSGGTAGTYNIATKAWSGLTALAQMAVTSSSDLYLVPGTYRFTISYTLTSPRGRAESFTRTADVSLASGKVHSLTATATGGRRDAVLESLETEPAFPVTIKKGETVVFKVYAVYSDGTRKDVSSAAANHANIPAQAYSSYLTRNSVTSVTGKAAGTASYGFQYTEDGVTVYKGGSIIVSQPVLASLSHNIGSSTYRSLIKKSRSFAVTAIYDDGSTRDVTASCSFTGSSTGTFEIALASKTYTIFKVGDMPISFTYTENGVTRTGSGTITGVDYVDSWYLAPSRNNSNVFALWLRWASASSAVEYGITNGAPCLYYQLGSSPTVYQGAYIPNNSSTYGTIRVKTMFRLMTDSGSEYYLGGTCSNAGGSIQSATWTRYTTTGSFD